VTRLLVYGSLRRNQRAHRFLRDCTFVEEVRVPGYDMFKLGWYPGVMPNPENKEGIVGEVFTIPDHLAEGLFDDLDSYEGYRPAHPEQSLFLREEVEVQGEPTTMYVYNGRADWQGVNKVQDGDWSKVK